MNARQAQAQEIQREFSLVVPAEIRMQVLAENETQAREVIAALLGAGRWQRDDQIGIGFALRTT